MRTTWIAQTNVEPELMSPHALRHACGVEQRPFYEIAVIPGAAVLPELPTIDGPVVFHGSGGDNEARRQTGSRT